MMALMWVSMRTRWARSSSVMSSSASQIWLSVVATLMGWSATLTDVTLTARFLAVARLRRQTGTATKLWISQILTRKALLEDPKLGTPIALPESLYLEILVGQMSAQEATVFENCPSIGDNLQEKDWTGKNRYTLDKLKNQSILAPTHLILEA
jgi:hypothetical protein